MPIFCNKGHYNNNYCLCDFLLAKMPFKHICFLCFKLENESLHFDKHSITLDIVIKFSCLTVSLIYHCFLDSPWYIPSYTSILNTNNSGNQAGQLDAAVQSMKLYWLSRSWESRDFNRNIPTGMIKKTLEKRVIQGSPQSAGKKMKRHRGMPYRQKHTLYSWCFG